MLLLLGGLGLLSAAQTSVSAYWASWADCLPVLRQHAAQAFPRAQPCGLDSFQQKLLTLVTARPGNPEMMQQDGPTELSVWHAWGNCRQHARRSWLILWHQGMRTPSRDSRTRLARTNSTSPFPRASVIGHLIVPWSYCPSVSLQICGGHVEERRRGRAALPERLARAEIPAVVVPWIGLGRMVAVRKPSGGVRGLVVGDVLRRLVSRTLAQQFAERFDAACQPYQYALSARCGSEALVHTLQYLTQTSPAMTVLSVDGVGAYDHVSRLAMLQALRDTPDACRVLPYVRLWYSTPSTYVWIDGNNCPHRVTQAEGGEQGDPLMPALFSLGMHRALTALQTELQPGERVFAFLDDLYIVAAPERVRTLFDAVARRLYEEVRISLNHAKTRVWNAAAVEPPGLDTLAPDGTAWCGAEASPAEERGITVLGAPLGTDAYVQTQLTAVSDRQLRFLQVLPTLPDLQVAWLLLLYCASPRSNYALRMLPPNLTAGFASASDQAVQQCLYSLLNADNSGHLPQQAACLA